MIDIRMKQAEALYLERLAREAEAGETLEEFGCTETASETENGSKITEMPKPASRPVHAETSKKATWVSKPSCDKFVTQTQAGLLSSGWDQPVPDGKGGVQIHFDAPGEEPVSYEKDGRAAQ